MLQGALGLALLPLLAWLTSVLFFLGINNGRIDSDIMGANHLDPHMGSDESEIRTQNRVKSENSIRPDQTSSFFHWTGPAFLYDDVWTFHLSSHAERESEPSVAKFTSLLFVYGAYMWSVELSGKLLNFSND